MKRKHLISIGSKREDAKQIDITIQKKHIYFGLIIGVIGLLVHQFIWSPYLIKQDAVVCLDGNVTILEDNMNYICGQYVGDNLTVKEIKQVINNKERNFNFNWSI